jgi:ABC-type transport system involved in multi-copper enzyme maturation permease subunit
VTATLTPYRSSVETGRAGFGQVLRAEWTKFRTVRGWLIGTAAAVLVMVLLGLLTGLGSHSSYNTGPGTPDIVGHPPVPIGPDGEAVTDRFYFVHRSLDGDGSITARVTSLTGTRIAQGQDPTVPSTPEPAEVQPWAKAGLIIKENTTQGSAYAAIMVTGAHGVRMQHNYTGDTAGPAGTVSMDSPRWLRLTRTGDTVTGYASTDGTTWTTVGTVRLAGLPATVPAGLFATSPMQENVTQHLGGGGRVVGSAALATARFDTVDLGGGWSGGAWSGGAIGTGDDEPGLNSASGFQQSGDSLTVTGAGDIAPDPAGSGDTVEQTLAGAFATLTVMVVIGVLFITAEYRRGMIRTSLAASPRRGQVLAAKAVVIGAVTFVVSLVAVAVTVPLTDHILRVNGNFVYPITGLTQVRVVAGTAALLAVAAVFALAVGTILRRSAGAVATVIVLLVLPYILATAGVLPAGPSQWLLRISPAAGFAIQQSMPAYPQLGRVFTPAFGFYPLAPWAGFAVLCGWTALALAAAAYLLRRRDA